MGDLGPSRDVYLDNAATSWPKPAAVLAAIEEFFAHAGGNTGRAGHRRSIAASRAVSLARESLADLLGAESPDNLAFTKNATEALNLAIHGLAADGVRIVTSSLEHNSVMRPLRHLEQAGRCTVEVVSADGNSGATDLAEWAERLGGDGPRLAVAMPGHKGLLGPTGTGLLYLAPGVEIEPLVRGGTGSQSELELQPEFAPDRYESGTLNAVGIVGLGAASEHLRAVGLDRVEARLAELGRGFRAALKAVRGLTLYGPADPADGVGILSLNLDGVPCATVARLLDDDWGVMTRAGLHCSPAAHRSLGTAPDGTLRFSWGYDTTDADIATAVEALRAVAHAAEPSGALA